MATTTPPVTTPELRERFRRLAEEWQDQARHMSVSRRMARLPAYQEIIAMGPPAVPLILEELRRRLDHWFLALEAITGVDPVPPELKGYVQAEADAWIAWGKAHGHLPA
jgi:hypothetical protein